MSNSLVLRSDSVNFDLRSSSAPSLLRRISLYPPSTPLSTYSSTHPFSYDSDTDSEPASFLLDPESLHVDVPAESILVAGSERGRRREGKKRNSDFVYFVEPDVRILRDMVFRRRTTPESESQMMSDERRLVRAEEFGGFFVNERGGGCGGGVFHQSQSAEEEENQQKMAGIVGIAQVSDEDVVIFHSSGVSRMEYQKLRQRVSVFDGESPDLSRVLNQTLVCEIEGVKFYRQAVTYDPRYDLLVFVSDALRINVLDLNSPTSSSSTRWMTDESSSNIVRRYTARSLVTMVDTIPTYPGYLFSVGRDCELRKFDYGEENCLESARGHGGGYVNCLCHSTEFGVVITGANDEKFAMWDPRSISSPIAGFGGEYGGGVYCALYRPHSRQIVGASSGCDVSTTDIRQYRQPLYVKKTRGLRSAPRSLIDVVNPDMFLMSGLSGGIVALRPNLESVWYMATPSGPSTIAFRSSSSWLTNQVEMMQVGERLEFVMEYSAYSSRMFVMLRMHGSSKELVLWSSML